MKDAREITACVVDYGSFIDVAEGLARTYSKVLYYSPFEQEFLNAHRCVIGDGLSRVEREDDFMDPDILKDIDLFIFPDQGYVGLQKYLRSIGKAVWGSMGASDLELYRTKFLDLLKQLNLPMVKSIRVRGLSRLADHLKTCTNKWIKINRYRDNMETWHHIDYAHSIPVLQELAYDLGGVAEQAVFVVQDDIPDALEIGYDGWNVLGQYPSSSYQGYEKKNELYLGSELPAEELPDGIKQVNEAMAPVLEELGYQNFIATEIRQVGDTPNFTDPTLRLPGQTGEHLLETCTNLADVIWHGANGELIKPEFSHQIAAEATLHYTAPGQWKVLRIPDSAKPFVKLYHYCVVDDLYHFPPHKSDEVGVVIANGDTVQEAIDNLRENFALIEDEPLKINLAGFADLLRDIQAAEEEEDMKFTDEKLPSPESILAEP